MTQTFESGFKSILAVKLDAADTTITLATVPTVTKGRLYLTNGQQEEWISFSGVSGSVLTGLVRGLSKTADPATSGAGLTWVAGTTVRLVAMHDQLQDSQEDQEINNGKKLNFGTSAYVWTENDGSDMKFKDGNNAERTLSDLSALSGSNDKVGISANDTTPAYLDTKITGGNGITVTETDDGANETLDFDIDLADTSIFTATQVAGKAAKTGVDGTINALITYEYVGDGEYLFGDGADGDVTISSNTTLTRDMFYNNLTIDSTFTLYPNGFKIYVKGTLTNNGTISRAGNAGSNGADGSGGNGGAGGAGATALDANSLEDSVAGGVGGAGANSSSSGDAGGAGGAANPSYTATDGVAGGVGGITASHSAAAGGAGGVSTQGADYDTVYSLSKIISILSNPASSKVGHLTSLLSDTLYKGPASAGGGGGGSSQAAYGGGGGGGGGGAGGVIWIAAKTFNNTNGVISSIGGTGGDGGDGETNGSTGGGGGGGGGNGGVVYLIYMELIDIGTVTLTGGAGGAGGLPFGTGGSGGAGTTGATGELIQIEI